MLRLNLRQKLRTGHVKRWHIVETTKQQSVAEHSFNVALISEEICSLIGYEQWLSACVSYAIHHDIPEVGLGDLPTSLKRVFSPEELDKVDSIMKEMDPLAYPRYETVKLIVKLADLVDSIVFLAQHGVGTHAKLVRKKIIVEAKKLINEFPESDKNRLINFLYEVTIWDTEDDDYKGVLWNQ